MNNLITDIEGLSVGHAEDHKVASGVTALLFDEPATASIAIHGGAPAGRDTALLEPGMTVEKVDALVLAGGSVYGLDAMGGVGSYLAAQGRGLAVGSVRVPITPGAALFDLLNGGDKDFSSEPLYWRLGFAAAAAAGASFALGSVGAGLGATTANLKGGLGSASEKTSNGFRVGALAAVNAVGVATIAGGPHFWAAPHEKNGEFGGLGWPDAFPAGDDFHIKGVAPQNTTIAIVVTDAALTKAEAKRLAVMAHDGMGRALRPAHAAMDGDTVFAAATGRAAAPSLYDLAEIGARAADCLARAIARAVFEATPLPFEGALPGWREKFGFHEKGF